MAALIDDIAKDYMSSQPLKRQLITEYNVILPVL